VISDSTEEALLSESSNGKSKNKNKRVDMSKQPRKSFGGLMSEEKVQSGNVGSETYLAYIKAAGMYGENMVKLSAEHIIL